MSKRLLWNLTIAITLLFTLIMAKKAFSKLHYYNNLKEKAQAHIDNWTISQDGSKFFLTADYQFEKNGVLQKGKTLFSNPIYLNTWAAKDAQNELVKKEWKVFFNPKKPHQHSLERVFPLKEFIHFFLTLILTIYFLVLKRFAFKRPQYQ